MFWNTSRFPSERALGFSLFIWKFLLPPSGRKLEKKLHYCFSSKSAAASIPQVKVLWLTYRLSKLKYFDWHTIQRAFTYRLQPPTQQQPLFHPFQSQLHVWERGTRSLRKGHGSLGGGGATFTSSFLGQGLLPASQSELPITHCAAQQSCCLVIAELVARLRKKFLSGCQWVDFYSYEIRLSLPHLFSLNSCHQPT